MGGLKRHSSPTAVEPRGVAFAPEVVTGISRPLTNDEQWSLYYFEAHAARCRHCADPLAVSREGKSLCDEGNDLAVDVAAILCRRRDGHVYSRAREDEHREVRLEMPAGHPQCESLLSAIRRCVRRGEKFLSKPRSFDRNYFVGPRQHHQQEKEKNDSRSERHSRSEHSSTTTKQNSSTSSTPHRRSSSRSKSPPSMRRPTFDVKVISPGAAAAAATTPEQEIKSQPRQRSKRDSLIEGLDQSKRGSLYGLDMGELEKDLRREQSLKYNLEVREPSYAAGGPVRRHVPIG